MHIKSSALIICSIAILFALSIGIAYIYTFFIYTPYQDLNVFDIYSEEVYEDNSEILLQKNQRLIEALYKLAKEKNASIIFSNTDYAGLSYIAYSDFFKKAINISDLSNDSKCIYLSDRSTFDTFVTDNVFLKGVYDLEVKGRYSTHDIIPLLASADYIYPLFLAADARGMYYTDLIDFDSLKKICKSLNYAVDISYKTKNFRFSDFLNMVKEGNVYQKTIFFTIFALVFSYIYIMLTLFRDKYRYFWIYHIFGLSRARIRLYIAMIALLIQSIALGLFYVLFSNIPILYLNASTLNNVFFYSLVVFTLLNLFVFIISYLQITLKFRRAGD